MDCYFVISVKCATDGAYLLKFETASLRFIILIELLNTLKNYATTTIQKNGYYGVKPHGKTQFLNNFLEKL